MTQPIIQKLNNDWENLSKNYKKPSMSYGESKNDLTDFRIELELDDDYIANILADIVESKHEQSWSDKQLRWPENSQLIIKHRDDISGYTATGDDENKYKIELLQFANLLTGIVEDLNVYREQIV